MPSLGACGKGKKEAPLFCVPLAATMLAAIAGLLILHCYFHSSHVCSSHGSYKLLEGIFVSPGPSTISDSRLNTSLILFLTSCLLQGC